ncbi:CAS1 appressorium specific protein [Blumeria hordei DH14]|uniref:CAS1 appressorium specific protein n=1 Tax=Blumeria graminis f. sp. hordei (strain DH14) TaxID=546991 RepID=N1J6V3_BLUG1|nr:CAS1 appressorium specific protein [Blumeria hordei DH14]
MLYPGAKIPTAKSSDSCDGSIGGSNEVKSLLLRRDGTAAYNGAKNTDNIDAINRDEQTLRVPTLVAGANDTSISVDSHAIMMTVKANENGVGSYTCMIDSTGTGTDTGAGIWTEMEVTSKSTDKIAPDGVADVEIQAAIDPDQTCTGRLDDKENVCMVKCCDATTSESLEKSVYVQIAEEDITPTPTAPASHIEAQATGTVGARHSNPRIKGSSGPIKVHPTQVSKPIN